MNKFQTNFILCIYLHNIMQNTAAYSLYSKEFSSTLIQTELPLSSQELNLTCELPEKKTATIYTVQFGCDVNMRGKPADSVHELKPSDVSVVAALGDSLSAGVFAKNPTMDLCLMRTMPEYRGVAWSIGGDLNISYVLTLPNILKQYNPMLKGYSTGLGMDMDKNSDTGFNMAMSGAKAQDLPFQATRLVEKLRSVPSIDYLNDWKVVTIFIGGNDLCKGCKQFDEFSPKTFYIHLKTTLDILSIIPRTYVNIAQIVDAYDLRYLDSEYCAMIHALLRVLGKCPCMNNSTISELSAAYAHVLWDLEEEYRLQDRDDFAVVVQPFFEEVRLNELEDVSSYFSGDCFHFSQKAQALSALLLWNNMLQPVGHKDNFFDSRSGITCASENQYFYTHRNSRTKVTRGITMTLVTVTFVLTLILIVIVMGLVGVCKYKKYGYKIIR